MNCNKTCNCQASLLCDKVSGACFRDKPKISTTGSVPYSTTQSGRPTTFVTTKTPLIITEKESTPSKVNIPTTYTIPTMAPENKLSTIKETRAVYFTTSDRFGKITLRKVTDDAVLKSTPSFSLYDNLNSRSSRVPSTTEPLLREIKETTNSQESSTYISTEIPTTDSKTTVLYYKNNGKFTFDENSVDDNLQRLTNSALGNENDHPTTENTFEIKRKFYDGGTTDPELNFPPRSTQVSLNMPKETKSTKAIIPQIITSNEKFPDNTLKFYKPLDIDDVNMTAPIILHEENYLNDEAYKSHDHHLEEHVISSVSVSTTLTVIVIILAAAFISVRYYRKTRDRDDNCKKENQGTTNVHRVSVVAHSVFHAPLPGKI